MVTSTTHSEIPTSAHPLPDGGNGTVGFIARELERIALALRAEPRPANYDELYAAQQALGWALDPDNFASPMKMLTGTP